MRDFEWYLHEIVVRYMKEKYPDIKVNYATFAKYFEKQSREFEKQFQELGKEKFEERIKGTLEKEVDRIMNERFLSLRIPK